MSEVSVNKWCREHGVKVSCSIEKSERGGTGLFYKYTTSDEILRVPRHLLLTKRKLRESIFLEKDLEEFDNLREKNILVYILRDILSRPNEESAGTEPEIKNNKTESSEKKIEEKDSKMTKIDIIWKKYGKFLPQGSDIDLPLSWSDDDVELLESTSIGLSLYSKKHALSRAYGDIKENPIPYRAEQLVASRCLELPVYEKDAKEGDETIGSEIAMVPVIDLVNHSQTPNARYEVDPKTGDVVLLSTVPAEKRVGEVLISYSADAKGASEMLYNYGFIDPEMTSCKKMTCIVPLDMEEDHANENVAQLEQQKQYFFNSPYGTITFSDDGQGGAVSWESDFIWLWSLPASDIEFAFNEATSEVTLLIKGHKIEDPMKIEETLKVKEPEYFTSSIAPLAEKMARERAADISEYLTAQQIELMALSDNNSHRDRISRLIKLENTTLLNFLVPGNRSH